MLKQKFSHNMPLSGTYLCHCNSFVVVLSVLSLVLTLLDPHCLAVILFLWFSFLPNNCPFAGLDQFGVERLYNGCLKIKASTVIVCQPIALEFFAHSKRDNVFYVELHMYIFYHSRFFFLT